MTAKPRARARTRKRPAVASPAGVDRFKKPVEMLINPLAGGAGPHSAEQAAEIFAEAGVDVRVTEAGPDALDAALQKIRSRRPDLIVVLAGDGTARIAASLCGPRGPLLAPLPGGTMNVLPRALYGEVDWRTALRDTLAGGVERMIGGGEVEGQRFYVAAMLGSAASFAPAREAVRRRRMLEACVKARDAWNRAFTGRLRFSLVGDEEHAALALALVCPLVSRSLNSEEPRLEAVAFDPRGPLEALRVGARVVLSPLIGDWRVDEAVHAGPAIGGVVRSRGRIPALLDGEPVRLGQRASFRYVPNAFRALAPPEPEPLP